MQGEAEAAAAVGPRLLLASAAPLPAPGSGAGGAREERGGPAPAVPNESGADGHSGRCGGDRRPMGAGQRAHLERGEREAGGESGLGTRGGQSQSRRSRARSRSHARRRATGSRRAGHGRTDGRRFPEGAAGGAATRRRSLAEAAAAERGNFPRGAGGGGGGKEPRHARVRRPARGLPRGSPRPRPGCGGWDVPGSGLGGEETPGRRRRLAPGGRGVAVPAGPAAGRVGDACSRLLTLRRVQMRRTEELPR